MQEYQSASYKGEVQGVCMLSDVDALLPDIMGFLCNYGKVSQLVIYILYKISHTAILRRLRKIEWLTNPTFFKYRKLGC